MGEKEQGKSKRQVDPADRYLEEIPPDVLEKLEKAERNAASRAGTGDHEKVSAQALRRVEQVNEEVQDKRKKQGKASETKAYIDFGAFSHMMKDKTISKENKDVAMEAFRVQLLREIAEKKLNPFSIPIRIRIKLKI